MEPRVGAVNERAMGVVCPEIVTDALEKIKSVPQQYPPPESLYGHNGFRKEVADDLQYVVR